MDKIPASDSMENPPQPPLDGLDPADLLRQGAADDTFAGAGAFQPPSLEEMAALFPQFEMLELIGQGGMGAVYKVRQKELDRVVALKILPPGIGKSSEFSSRFTREAKALAKLNHPGIVTIHEFGQADGLYFILMEFVDGVNLAQLLKTGRISPREALAIVPQICDALQFAHDQGIVHRDIKPENILLDRLGRVKVADFGIAKVVADPLGSGDTFVPEDGTIVGKIIGTPEYMAPEQIYRPAEVDHRADIYALGVVFYQILTGELPGKEMQAPSKKVHIDVRLDEIVLRAMEKAPELRYQTARELRTVLDEMPPAIPPKPVARRGMMRRWWWMFLVMIPLGVAFGFGAGALFSYVAPKKFEVETVVEVRPADVSQAGPAFFVNQFEKITSRSTLAAVSQELELANKWGVAEEQVVPVLKGIVSVQNIRGTDLLTIRVRHTNPQDAVDIATALAGSYRKIFNGEVIVHETPVLPNTPVSPNVALILFLGSTVGLLLSPLLALIVIPLLQWMFPDGRMRPSGGGKGRSPTPGSSKRMVWIVAICLVAGALWVVLRNSGTFYPASSLSPRYKAPVLGRIVFKFTHPESLGAKSVSYDVKKWGDTQWTPDSGNAITLIGGQSLLVKSRVSALRPDAPVAFVTTSSDDSHWETQELKIGGDDSLQQLVFSNGLRVEIRWTPVASSNGNSEPPDPTQQDVMRQASKWADEKHPVSEGQPVEDDANPQSLAEEFADLQIKAIQARAAYLENDPLRMQAEEKLANFIRSHPDFPDDLSRKLVDQRRVELALKIGGMAKKFGSGHAEILQLRRELDLLEQVPEIGAKQLAVESEKVILASHLPENNRLQIRKVANSDPNAELMNMEVTTDGNEVLEQEIGVGRDVIVADQHVESVSIVSEADEHRLDITLNRIGGARLAKATARDLGKMRLGILVNGRIISAPVVQNQLGKRFVISGLKSREEALDLLRSFPSWDAQIKSWEAVTWLREIDEGKYRESYESSSSVLQEKFSQEIWVVMLTNLREPLGIVGSRGLKKYSEVKSVDGNEYRLILFDTHFSNQQDAVETVTFVKERDGAWKAAGYFIR